MAFTHGRKARFTLNAQDYSAYLDNIDKDATVDHAETSVYTVNSKTYVPGLIDGKFALAGRFDPTIDALLAGLLQADPVAFIYGPQGTSGGSVKYTGSALLINYKVATPIGGAATFTAEVQISGDVTRGAY